MELAFFKFTFFVLIGLAILSLLAIVTMFAVVALKVLWSWLRPRLGVHARVARARHA